MTSSPTPSAPNPRQVAQQHRTKQLKKERTRRAVIGGAILVGIAAIILAVTLFMRRQKQNNAESVVSEGTIPAYGNQFGGIVVVKDGKLKKGPGGNVNADQVGPAATEPSEKAPSGSAKAPAGQPAQVIVYLDMACPYCKKLEESYGQKFYEFVDQGKITLEYRIIAILDGASNRQYSTRSGAAIASVADRYPEKFRNVLKAFFDNQPNEMTGEDNAWIKDTLTNAGVPDDIKSMVDNKAFQPYIKFANALAAKDGVRGTPSVYIEGTKWDPQKDSDLIKVIEQAVSVRK